MKPAWSLLGFSLVLLSAGCSGLGSSQPVGNFSGRVSLPPIPDDTPAAVRSQLEQLRSTEPLRRAHAAVLLGRMRAEAKPAVPDLLATLKDDNRPVRRGATEALGNIGDPRAVDALLAIVKNGDEDWGVRSGAARALGKLRDPRAVGPLMDALTDMISHVRRSAANALGSLGNPAAVAALTRAARYDSDETVRRAAKAALVKVHAENQHAADRPGLRRGVGGAT